MERSATTMKTATTYLGGKLTRHGSKGLALLAAMTIGTITSACHSVLPTSTSRDVRVERPLGSRAPMEGLSVRSQAQVFEGACDIRASVEAFRAALGTLNPNQPGS